MLFSEIHVQESVQSEGLWVISAIIAKYYPCADPENRDSNWQFFYIQSELRGKRGPGLDHI